MEEYTRVWSQKIELFGDHKGECLKRFKEITSGWLMRTNLMDSLVWLEMIVKVIYVLLCKQL